MQRQSSAKKKLQEEADERKLQLEEAKKEQDRIAEENRQKRDAEEEEMKQQSAWEQDHAIPETGGMQTDYATPKSSMASSWQGSSNQVEKSLGEIEKRLGLIENMISRTVTCDSSPEDPMLGLRKALRSEKGAQTAITSVRKLLYNKESELRPQIVSSGRQRLSQLHYRLCKAQTVFDERRRPTSEAARELCGHQPAAEPNHTEERWHVDQQHEEWQSNWWSKDTNWWSNGADNGADRMDTDTEPKQYQEWQEDIPMLDCEIEFAEKVETQDTWDSNRDTWDSKKDTWNSWWSNDASDETPAPATTGKASSKAAPKPTISTSNLAKGHSWQRAEVRHGFGRFSD